MRIERIAMIVVLGTVAVVVAVVEGPLAGLVVLCLGLAIGSRVYARRRLGAGNGNGPPGSPR